MRILTLLVAGGIALAASMSSSYAAPVSVPPGSNNGAAPGVEEVALHCGPHSHYVHGYRNKRGHYVKAHCVRNRH